MSQEKSLLLDEFHTLLNKLEISEQISFLENNNEKIKNKIQYQESGVRTLTQVNSFSLGVLSSHIDREVSH